MCNSWIAYYLLSCVQVSCNDWSISDEVTSAYLLEKLMSSHSTKALRLEHGFPLDGADSWVGSSYFASEPWTLDAELAAHVQKAVNTGQPQAPYVLHRPWADQMQVRASYNNLLLQASRKSVSAMGHMSSELQA